MPDGHRTKNTSSSSHSQQFDQGRKGLALMEQRCSGDYDVELLRSCVNMSASSHFDVQYQISEHTRRSRLKCESRPPTERNFVGSIRTVYRCGSTVLDSQCIGEPLQIAMLVETILARSAWRFETLIGPAKDGDDAFVVRESSCCYE